MGLVLNMGPGLLLSAAVVFPVVGAVLVTLRMRLKRQKKLKLGIEDWLVVPALLLIVAMGIVTIYGVSEKSIGYPTPPESDPAYQLYTRAKGSATYWNIEWMQPLALGFIKISFVFFYRRIINFGPHKSVFNVISLAAIVIMVLWMCSMVIAVMLIFPGHVEAFWGPVPGRRKYCWVTVKFLYGFTWSDVGTDLIVLVMPIPSVLKLRLPTRRKIAVLAVFAVGAITVAASIIRAMFYIRLLDSRWDANPNMITTNAIYWMLMETGLALIAVNLPLLYSTIREEGVESVIRSARSFASVVSSRSSSKVNTRVSTTDKTRRSYEGAESIEMVPNQFNTKSKATRSESSNDIDIEVGNINVKESHGVDSRV